MFVNREQELRYLNDVLKRGKSGRAQLVLIYGRRRVGKTALIRRWAEQSGTSYTYWVAEKTTAALQRRQLYAKLLNVGESQAPNFASWGELWDAAASLLGDKRHILLIDEVTYIADADPAALSALQHAWDQRFKDSKLIIVLSGSHVRTMETLLTRQSPLFGRLTGQWHLQPLPFSSLTGFFPDWTAAELVNLYAMVGGVPAYLEWLDPERSFIDNLHQVILSPGSMFLAEPRFLLYDEVREPRTYLAILKAIGAGYHTFRDISEKCLVSTSNLSIYLSTLQELRIVERRLPATIKPSNRRQSRRGRYHLSDPYFRFYFRFLDPQREDLDYDRERVFSYIQEGLRSFVGATAFEELSRQWVHHQGQLGQLSVKFEQVGQHWSRNVQIDVVGISWERKVLLLGECKWGRESLSQRVVRDLIDKKTQQILKDLSIEKSEWRIRYAFFSRAVFTGPAKKMAEKVEAKMVSLDELVSGLP